MTKNELREVQRLALMHKLGMAPNVARGLSALIRASRTARSRAELFEYATLFSVATHPDFIV